VRWKMTEVVPFLYGEQREMMRSWRWFNTGGGGHFKSFGYGRGRMKQMNALVSIVAYDF
jgi:hypothetical protein